MNVGAGESLPENVDVAIEASGVAAALGGVIGATRPGGVIVQAGNLRAGTIEASIAGIVIKEIDYRGSYRFASEMDTAIRMLAEGLDVSSVITHEFSIDDAEEAFRNRDDHRGVEGAAAVGRLSFRSQRASRMVSRSDIAGVPVTNST